MACETLRREFENSKGDKILFATRQLPASKSLELHVELMGKVGTTAFPFIDDNYDFGSFISLMRSNEHGVITELMKRVICYSVVEGKEVQSHNYDMYFDGELMLACNVFAFVLEANYKSFFKQGLEMNERRRLAAEEASALESQRNSSPKT